MPGDTRSKISLPDTSFQKGRENMQEYLRELMKGLGPHRAMVFHPDKSLCDDT